MNKNKLSLLASIFLVIFAKNTVAHAATISIGAGDDVNVSTSTANDDDVNFTGDGTLLVDEDNTVASVDTHTIGSGTINFNTAEADLTVTGDVGTTTTTLYQIIFNLTSESTDETLTLGGNLYTDQGVNTANDGEGVLTFNGSSAQTVSSSLGSESLKLKSISVTQSAGFVLNGDAYANSFTASGSGVLAMSGTGSATFTTSTFSGSATVGGTGTMSFGNTSLSEGKELTINNDNVSFADITMGSTDATILTISTGKTIAVTGDISATGVIIGDTDGAGNVLFSGSSAQSVASGIELGQSSNRLNTISSSNTSGITFNNDVYATDIDFTANNTESENVESTISIASGKTLDISGNITESGTGSGFIKGDGTLNLSGTSAQTIAASLGASTTDQLGELDINNASGATLNDNAYVGTLTVNTNTALVANATLDADSSAINNDLTLSGSGTINLGAASIASAKTLTLNSDARFDSIAMTDSDSTVNIGSGKTLRITGNITGTGVIKGNSNGLGDVSFTGSSAQSVASGIELGQSASRLNAINVSNVNGLTLNNDAFTTDLNFTNTSSEASLSIASSQTLDVSGDIAQSDSGSSVIQGSSGTLKLSGSTQQNLYASAGASASRLGTLEINNAAGIVLHQDSYINTLSQTSGALKVAGDKTLNVTNAVNLSGKTFISAVGSSAFSKIKSGADVTVSDATNISFDYSNSTADLDYTGGTEYVVLESASGISGNVANINVSDNSYLFNNNLSQSGNNVVTTVSYSSNFNESTLGTRNYALLDNALQYTDMSSGIISLSTQEEISEAADTLVPMTNGAVVNTTLAANQNTTNITSLHVKALNDNLLGFSTGGKEDTKWIWGQAFGGGSTQSARKGSSGYTAASGGVIFGADKYITGRVGRIIIGSALSYNRSKIKGDSIADNDDTIDSYQLILYNNNANKSGLGIYNNNLLNIAFNQYKTRRTIKVGSYQSHATGNFDGMSYALKTGLGYHMKLSERFLLSPNASIQYLTITQDAYQETGAGNSGLKVNNDDYTNYIAELGVDLTSKLRYGKNLFIPKLSLAWNRYLQNNQQKSVVSFIGGGGNIQNNSIVPQRDRFNFGFGLDASNGSAHSIALKYDLQLANNFDSHIGSIQYRFAF